MDNKQDEIWKDILGYEGSYQVSNFGRVRSLPRLKGSKHGGVTAIKGRILKPLSGRAYLSVFLLSNGKRLNVSIHRLVAQAFLSNPSKKEHVNHIDCNKTNNNASNLEWCTRSENARHAVENGLYVSTNRKNIFVFSTLGVLIKEFDSVNDCAVFLNRSQSAVSMAVTRKSRINGYLVSYERSILIPTKKHGCCVESTDSNGIKRIHANAKQAAKDLSIGSVYDIRLVCKGIKARYKGYGFRHLD